MNIKTCKRDYVKSVTHTDIIRIGISFGVAVAWWIWDQDIWLKLMVVGMYEVVLLQVLHFFHTQSWNNRLLVYNQSVVLRAVLKSTDNSNASSSEKFCDEVELVDCSLIGGEDDGLWYVHFWGILLKYSCSFILCRLIVGAGFYDVFFSFLHDCWAHVLNNVLGSLVLLFCLIVFGACWYSGLFLRHESKE
jgi:hypothetical protein